MSGWQDWVVGALLALCVVRIVYGVIRSFRRAQRGGSPCGHCSGCCVSKHSHTKHDACCGPERKKQKKNCCG